MGVEERLESYKQGTNLEKYHVKKALRWQRAADQLQMLTFLTLCNPITIACDKTYKYGGNPDRFLLVCRYRKILSRDIGVFTTYKIWKHSMLDCPKEYFQKTGRKKGLICRYKPSSLLHVQLNLFLNFVVALFQLKLDGFF